MIDFNYYITQIKEELEGAKDYCKKAIDLKSEHGNWAVIYYKMGEAELNHAQSLMQIFEDDYAKNKKEDSLYSQMHKCVSDTYSTNAAEARHLQEIYTMK